MPLRDDAPIGAPCWVDLFTSDPERTQAFYNELFGWTCETMRFDWPTLIGNVRREVDRLNGVYTRTLENAGVDRFLTRAVLEGVAFGLRDSMELIRGAGLGEIRQVRVDRGGRGKADRLADIAHRRGIAVLGRVALDEVEDLLLTLG